MTDQGRSKPPRVTSVEIGPRTRILCWAFGITLVAAGAVAAFVSNNQAGTTALVLFGGLLLFIAITRRIPLLIEVGTAKLDTDRKSVVLGKSVSVRVDLGGLRCIKKKTQYL